MADNNHMHVIEADIQTDVNNIGKRGVNGKQISEPQRSRNPIRNAITTIATDSTDTIEYMQKEVDDQLAHIADYSSTFSYATNVLSEGLKERDYLVAINDRATKTARLLTEPETKYTDDGSVPKFSWMDDYGKWVFSVPRWPTFMRFNVKRLIAVEANKGGNLSEGEVFEDSVKYTASGDRAGITDINIMDWFSGMKLTAGLCPALTNSYPVDSNGVFVDPTTGEPKDTMGTEPWNYNFNNLGRPSLHITVPRGLAGSDEVQMQFRPFFTEKAWTNGNIAAGMPSNYVIGCGRYEKMVDGKVVEVGNETPGRPMTGAIIIFQKCAVRENSGLAKSTKNQTALAKIFVENTDTALLEENWDWYQQTAVYLPRGAHTTACLIDSNGDKFFQDVAWGARPSIDSGYWALHSFSYISDDYEPGRFVFSGGRYVSKNGKTKFGYAFKGIPRSPETTSNPTGAEGFVPRSHEYIGVYHTGEGRYYIDRKGVGNNDDKNACAAKYFMVPVKIIGVYDRLLSDQEDIIHN